MTMLPPGLSLITACGNRLVFLHRALPTWLAMAVDEVIVVDWASAPPIRRADLPADPRLRLIRVEAEGWHLPSAYNLGLRLARFRNVMKLDCDITAAPWALAVNVPAPGAFITGNWRRAPQGQQHLNGSFIAAQADLAAIGGFNEWFEGYGWDDDDLYTRLLAQGLTRRLIAPGSLSHLPHSDALRGADGSPALHIQMNRALADLMPVWDANSPSRHFHAIGPDHFTAAPRIRAPLHFRQMARSLASYRMLGPASLHLPPAAARRAAKRGQMPQPALHLDRRIFLEVQHGLGNRLRTLASGQSLAAATGRHLHLIWPTDAHCGAAVTDLLQGLTALTTFDNPSASRHDAMEGPAGNRPHPIRLDPNRDAYIRSADVLNHPGAQDLRPHLHALIPAPEVSALIAPFARRFATTAHIRAEGASGWSQPSDDPRQWSATSTATLTHWRALSQPARFLAALRGRRGSIFVASDSAAIIAPLEQALGRPLAHLPGGQSGHRDRAQVVHAFADMLLLARGQHFLASGWSAFSDVAHLLARDQSRAVAGMDF